MNSFCFSLCIWMCFPLFDLKTKLDGYDLGNEFTCFSLTKLNAFSLKCWDLFTYYGCGINKTISRVIYIYFDLLHVLILQRWIDLLGNVEIGFPIMVVA